MAKVSLDKDKLKNFFALHVEKIVLAIILALVAVFVYRGLSLEELGQTPAQLDTLTATAATKMSENSWPNVMDENRPPSGYGERGKNSYVPTQDTFYAIEKPLKPPGRNLGENRKDPTLFPPARIEVYSVSGPVAFRMQPDDVDALADAKEAELKKKEVRPKVEKKKKQRGMGGSSSAMMSEMSPEMMSGPAGGSEGGSGSMGMGSMGMESGMYGAGMGGTTANPQQIPGFRAGMGAIARPANIVAVKAVVELRKQWDEFERTFSTAKGYNPQRDVPRFIMFLAQRADVTDDPNKTLTEADWTNIANNESVRRQIIENRWFGFAQEIVDRRYMSPVLTMPIPPLMMRNLDPLALHADTPRQKMMQPMMPFAARGTKKKDGKAEEPKPAAKVGDAPSSSPMMGMAGSPYGGMGMSGSAMPGFGAEMGSSGMPGPYGMPGSGYGMSGPGYGSEGSSMGSEMAGMMPGSMGSEMAGMSGMMSGMGYGSGMYGSEYSGASAAMGAEGGSSMYGGYGMPGMVAPGPLADYALIRFYDFSAEPGHKYRYRVSVFLDDPNHPQMPGAEPNERTLDDTVKTRLAEVLKQEKAKETESGFPSRIYYIRTDWSEPSAVVAVDAEEISLAGKIETQKPVPVPNSEQLMQVNELKGSVMSVVWDPTRATDIPGVLESLRGTVYNFTANAVVIHPVFLQYKQLDNYNFVTNRCMLDLRGGEPLPGTADKDPLTALGEYIFLNDTGEMFVRNELEDYDEFQMHTPPEIEAPAGAMGGFGEEMAAPGSEMPGSSGGGRRQRRGSGVP